MGMAIDLSGEKFGRLTATKRVGVNKNKKVLWECVCECGNKINVPTSNLTTGHTRSCGCINVDRLKTHGHSHTRIWGIWQGMLRRCYDENCTNYQGYGGRGISVCNEWREDFSAFLRWANENGYMDTLTIDRTDVNGNYTPENCRWATMKEQCNNKRSNEYLIFKGEKHTVAEWANILGIATNTLWMRINVHGWSVERALTEKVRTEKHKKKT